MPELLLLKFCHHHSHFWAATLDFTTFFMMSFFKWAIPFLQLGCFCVDRDYLPTRISADVGYYSCFLIYSTFYLFPIDCKIIKFFLYLFAYFFETIMMIS